MLSPTEMQQDVERIFEIIRSLPERSGYNNRSLEGPKDAPMRPFGFACVYPEEPGKPGYRVYFFGDVPQLLDREGVREKVVGYQLSEETLTDHREQMQVWSALDGHAARDLYLDSHWHAARARGIPLTFIMFSRIEADGSLAAHLYHPSGVPPHICLDLLHRMVVDLQRSSSD